MRVISHTLATQGMQMYSLATHHHVIQVISPPTRLSECAIVILLHSTLCLPTYTRILGIHLSPDMTQIDVIYSTNYIAQNVAWTTVQFLQEIRGRFSAILITNWQNCVLHIIFKSPEKLSCYSCSFRYNNCCTCAIEQFPASIILSRMYSFTSIVQPRVLSFVFLWNYVMWFSSVI